MFMWRLELDEEFYRVYDSSKMIAGYFDPDYGEIFPQEKEQELILKMIHDKEKIPGGFLMVPFIKFGLFDKDLDTDLSYIESQIQTVSARLKKWRNFIETNHCEFHSVRISHTDQDMLTITFPVKFSQPIPLEEKELIKELGSTLDLLQKLGLL